MSSAIERFLLERILPLWGKWYGGLLVGSIVVVLTFLSIIDDPSSIGLFDWITLGTVFAVVLVIWKLTNPHKRHPKGQVGICIAIRAESDVEHGKVDFKLIDSLKQKLKLGISSNISVVSLSNQECQDLDDAQAAAKRLIGTRSHMILYGRVVSGSAGGKPVASIQLQAAVIHSNSNLKNQTLLSQEIGIGIPKEVIIDLQNDLKDFEILAKQLDYVAKYIIAIAAFLSGDFNYAADLLHTLEISKDSADMKSTSLFYLQSVLPRRIRAVRHCQISSAYRNYSRARVDAELLTCEPIVDELLAQNPDDYLGLLSKSILVFLKNRDVKQAKALLAKCKKKRDATWMYNYAFLLAYEGELWEAHDMYKQAFNAPTHIGSVPVESEEFIRIVMGREGKHRQLTFAIALINYNAKKDFNLAAEAFRDFLDIEGAQEAWPQAFALSSKLLLRCKSKAR